VFAQLRRIEPHAEARASEELRRRAAMAAPRQAAGS
jgi:hypothetical protein